MSFEEQNEEEFDITKKNSPPLSLVHPILNQLLEFKERKLKACKFCNKTGWIPPGDRCVCMKEVDFQYRLRCSNMPPKYKEVKFENFVNQDHPGYKKVLYYSKNIITARYKGTGIHLFGAGSGTGKTLLASCILLNAMRQGSFTWFTSMSHLLEDIKSGFDNQDKKKIIEWAMFKSDFLFLDEIEKFNPGSEWVKDRCNDLIQERVNNLLPIITTGNEPLEALNRIYQNHLISRFIGTQIEVSIDSTVDYRKNVLKENLFDGLESAGDIL